MKKKIDIVIFAPNRDLSNKCLNKIIKYKKKFNIVLLVSDIELKKKLENNDFNDFQWVKNNKPNSSKILKIIKKLNSKNLYGFSFQHEWQIKEDLLEKFKFIFNFHFGNLPNYRGHNPIIHAILNNEKYIYGIIHAIDKNLDEGKLLTKIKVKNNNKLSSKDIEKILANKFASYFEKLIVKLINKKRLIFKEINNVGKFFYLKNDIKKLKEVKNYREILTKARAFDYPPHIPAFIKIKNLKIYLKLKPY